MTRARFSLAALAAFLILATTVRAAGKAPPPLPDDDAPAPAPKTSPAPALPPAPPIAPPPAKETKAKPSNPIVAELETPAGSDELTKEAEALLLSIRRDASGRDAYVFVDAKMFEGKKADDVAALRDKLAAVIKDGWIAARLRQNGQGPAFLADVIVPPAGLSAVPEDDRARKLEERTKRAEVEVPRLRQRLEAEFLAKQPSKFGFGAASAAGQANPLMDDAALQWLSAFLDKAAELSAEIIRNRRQRAPVPRPILTQAPKTTPSAEFPRPSVAFGGNALYPNPAEINGRLISISMVFEPVLKDGQPTGKMTRKIAVADVTPGSPLIIETLPITGSEKKDKFVINGKHFSLYQNTFAVPGTEPARTDVGFALTALDDKDKAILKDGQKEKLYASESGMAEVRARQALDPAVGAKVTLGNQTYWVAPGFIRDQAGFLLYSEDAIRQMGDPRVDPINLSPSLIVMTDQANGPNSDRLGDRLKIPGSEAAGGTGKGYAVVWNQKTLQWHVEEANGSEKAVAVAGEETQPQGKPSKGGGEASASSEPEGSEKPSRSSGGAPNTSPEASSPWDYDEALLNQNANAQHYELGQIGKWHLMYQRDKGSNAFYVNVFKDRMLFFPGVPLCDNANVDSCITIHGNELWVRSVEFTPGGASVARLDKTKIQEGKTKIPEGEITLSRQTLYRFSLDSIKKLKDEEKFANAQDLAFVQVVEDPATQSGKDEFVVSVKRDDWRSALEKFFSEYGDKSTIFGKKNQGNRDSLVRFVEDHLKIDEPLIRNHENPKSKKPDWNPSVTIKTYPSESLGQPNMSLWIARFKCDATDTKLFPGHGAQHANYKLVWKDLKVQTEGPLPSK